MLTLTPAPMTPAINHAPALLFDVYQCRTSQREQPTTWLLTAMQADEAIVNDVCRQLADLPITPVIRVCFAGTMDVAPAHFWYARARA